MANSKHGYSSQSEKWSVAPITRAFDVSPTGVDSNGDAAGTDLPINTRAIMVSEDDMTVSGILVGQDLDTAAGIHTTHNLKAGILYPFAFRRITAVSTGSVKGYA